MFKPIIRRWLPYLGSLWGLAVGSGSLGGGRALRVTTESSLLSGIDVSPVSKHPACLH